MATPAVRMAATRLSTASREPNETAMCAILGVSPGEFISSRRAPELSARKRDVNGRVLLTYFGPIIALTEASPGTLLKHIDARVDRLQPPRDEQRNRSGKTRTS